MCVRRVLIFENASLRTVLLRRARAAGQLNGLARFDSMKMVRRNVCEDVSLCRRPGGCQMTTLFEGNICLRKANRQSLAQTFRPVSAGLQAVEQHLTCALGDAFHASQAPVRIRQWIASHIGRAKQELQSVVASDFKDSLCQLAGYTAVSMSDTLTR